MKKSKPSESPMFSDRDRCLVEFLLSSGIRINELTFSMLDEYSANKRSKS